MNRNMKVSTVSLYGDTVASLAELLEFEERLKDEIYEYVTEYGVVDFLNNIEIFSLDEDVVEKLQAIKNIIAAYNEEYGDLIFNPNGGDK